MNEFNIFLKLQKWPDLIGLMSLELGAPGLRRTDIFSFLHTWEVTSIEVVAVEHPDLTDEINAPFSGYSAQVIIRSLCGDFGEKAEKACLILAKKILFMIRSAYDPDAILAMNGTDKLNV